MSDDFDKSVARLLETIWPLDPLDRAIDRSPDG